MRTMRKRSGSIHAVAWAKGGAQDQTRLDATPIDCFHANKAGVSVDSHGVRVVSYGAQRHEEQIRDDFNTDSLFNSEPRKVRAVTLPRFSWDAK